MVKYIISCLLKQSDLFFDRSQDAFEPLCEYKIYYSYEFFAETKQGVSYMFSLFLLSRKQIYKQHLNLCITETIPSSFLTNFK